jgi:hypothetical protein
LSVSWQHDKDDVDEDYFGYWADDPFYGREPQEPDGPDGPDCLWCDDAGCRRCVPSRWERIRRALRRCLDRLRWRGPKADDPWGRSVDELPF